MFFVPEPAEEDNPTSAAALSAFLKVYFVSVPVLLTDATLVVLFTSVVLFCVYVFATKWVWANTTPVSLDCNADPVIVDFAAPASSASAQTTNLFVRFGVLFVPSQRSHPVGIVAMVPDHIAIIPEGTAYPDHSGAVAPEFITSALYAVPFASLAQTVEEEA